MKGRTNLKKYEIETIFEGHSKSHYLRDEKEAERIFKEKKNEFEHNEEIKQISLRIVSLKNDEIIKETLEEIKRKEIE